MFRSITVAAIAAATGTLVCSAILGAFTGFPALGRLGDLVVIDLLCCGMLVFAEAKATLRGENVPAPRPSAEIIAFPLQVTQPPADWTAYPERVAG